MWGSFSTMISTLITIICLCGGLCKITRQVSSAVLWHNTSSHLINGSTDSISQNMIQNITILLTTFPCSLTTTHLTVAIWVGLNTEKTYVALVTIISYLLTNMQYRPRSSLYKLNRNGSSTYPRYTEIMFLFFSNGSAMEGHLFILSYCQWKSRLRTLMFCTSKACHAWQDSMWHICNVYWAKQEQKTCKELS